MDIENSMVVGAQDLYDGCGRAYDRSSSLEEARDYFKTKDDGFFEIQDHLLDDGFAQILRHLISAINAETETKKEAHRLKAVNVVERAIEFLASKKVNEVHQ